jgi:small GTP-binding protein
MVSKGGRFAFKVSVIGEYAVGKTSLIKRYMTNTFDEGYKATLGAAISTFDTTVDGNEVSLQVWDLAGQNPFRKVRHQYLFGSDFAVAVFDLTRRESLDALAEWVADVRSADPEAICILVGNKSDLVEEREVRQGDARTVAKQLKTTEYMETSAKDGTNIGELFQAIAKALVQRTQR